MTLIEPLTHNSSGKGSAGVTAPHNNNLLVWQDMRTLVSCKSFNITYDLSKLLLCLSHVRSSEWQHSGALDNSVFMHEILAV